MTFPKLLIPIVVLAAACVPVSATSIIYCSNGCSPDTAAAFTTATASLFFPNAPILFTTAGLSADTTTYTDSVSGTEFIDNNGTDTSIGLGFDGPPIGAGLTTFTNGDVIEILLPANVYAFGTNLQASSTGMLCIETGTFSHSCSTNPVSLPSSTSEFIGVVSASPISTLWFATPNAATVQLTNFEIGQQAPDPPPADTPEVATMFMIGTGLISLGVMRRRVAVP